jgi:hypothetical protein
MFNSLFGSVSQKTGSERLFSSAFQRCPTSPMENVGHTEVWKRTKKKKKSNGQGFSLPKEKISSQPQKLSCLASHILSSVLLKAFNCRYHVSDPVFL